MSHKHRENFEHCLRVALICEYISCAKGMSVEKAHNAFAAGMLHDLMKGRKRGGSKHAKLGKELAKRMGMPKSVCNAIAVHNCKDQEKILLEKNVAKILFIADKIDKPNKPKYRKKQYPKPIDDMFEALGREAFRPTKSRREKEKSLDSCIMLWFRIKRKMEAYDDERRY